MSHNPMGLHGLLQGYLYQRLQKQSVTVAPVCSVRQHRIKKLVSVKKGRKHKDTVAGATLLVLTNGPHYQNMHSRKVKRDVTQRTALRKSIHTTPLPLPPLWGADCTLLTAKKFLKWNIGKRMKNCHVSGHVISWCFDTAMTPRRWASGGSHGGVSKQQSSLLWRRRIW
jgi:hypothetical protein